MAQPGRVFERAGVNQGVFAAEVGEGAGLSLEKETVEFYRQSHFSVL
jgi:hypothetical protein